MKNTFTGLLVLCLCLGGCGKKKTPDEAANELFVEAVELVNNAKSEESTNIPAAIKSYEQALVKVRKIISEYKASDIAVKLVSGETLFTGRSIEQIEDRVGELKYELERRAEEARQAEQARQAEEARRAKEKKLQAKNEEIQRAEAKAQHDLILGSIRRINDDLIKAFIQNPNYIDMKTLRVQRTNEGLVLEFFNDPSRPLFDDGKSELTKYGKLLFSIVAWTLARNDTALTSSIEVEGHTGVNFKEIKNDDKWSISSKRALEVRNHIEKEGVKEKQFHKIVGCGDTRPLKVYSYNLNHPHHSRVSIRVRAKEVPQKKN